MKGQGLALAFLFVGVAGAARESSAGDLHIESGNGCAWRYSFMFTDRYAERPGAGENMGCSSPAAQKKLSNHTYS